MSTNESQSKITTEVEGDYFLLNPPLRPKTEVADYVESEGILVPRRFSGLAEALASGKPFIIRSEHPQDYDGASGLFKSLRVTEEDVLEGRKTINEEGGEIDWDTFYSSIYSLDVTRVHDQILGNIGEVSQRELEASLARFSRRNSKGYCDLLGLSMAELEKDLSFSYWEYIDGERLIMVADDVVAGRYHIFAYPKRNEDRALRWYAYTILEDNEIVKSCVLGKPKSKIEAETENLRAIEFYERVRRLSHFDADNAPLIESVSVGQKDFFLQYHRGRDFSPSDFVLEREPGSREVEAEYVRGATDKNGMICDTRFWYGDHYELQDEEASFDFHWNHNFSELMTPRRKAQFVQGDDFSHFVLKTTDMHLQKSKLFKPQVSVFLTDDQMFKILPELEASRERAIDFVKILGSEYEDFRVQLSVVSDGRRAIIGRV